MTRQKDKGKKWRRSIHRMGAERERGRKQKGKLDTVERASHKKIGREGEHENHERTKH
jgi:hypothetical protein